MNAQAWSVSQAIAEYALYMKHQGILHDDGNITEDELRQRLAQAFDTLADICMENGVQTKDEVFNLVVQFVLCELSTIKVAIPLKELSRTARITSVERATPQPVMLDDN